MLAPRSTSSRRRLHGADADNDGVHSPKEHWSASPTPRTGDANFFAQVAVTAILRL
jgi:hypothetical protein